ncbi:helix-turn-helix transcriptional regulator [Nocardioides sp. SYSU D00065]|uniref:helix-turn-helix transcriptional regulator n=1 Tax=Nocardioides sp. SYSU D00065 TaxID=2817378 RepID=UPI001B332E50|nr:helix-turn-helix transcriptional regulator [Nocardioides sp. SYSU D00065]
MRRKRKDAGYSQTDLAALVGCTQQYISMLENGTDSDCSERIAERIAKRLNVDLEDLFEERELVRTPRIATPSRGGSAA